MLHQDESRNRAEAIIEEHFSELSCGEFSSFVVQKFLLLCDVSFINRIENKMEDLSSLLEINQGLCRVFQSFFERISKPEVQIRNQAWFLGDLVSLKVHHQRQSTDFLHRWKLPPSGDDQEVGPVFQGENRRVLPQRSPGGGQRQNSLVNALRLNPRNVMELLLSSSEDYPNAVLKELLPDFHEDLLEVLRTQGEVH